MRQIKENIWKIKTTISGRSNYDFFETEDKKYCVYFEHIEEYGMMKFISPVEIWTGKQNPKVLFQSKKTKFEYQYSRSCYYLEKSNIIALLTPCLKQNHYDLLYVLLDLTKKQFAIINAPNFDPKELSNNEIQLVLNFRYSYDQAVKDKIAMDNGKIIYLNELTWLNTDKLDKVCKLK